MSLVFFLFPPFSSCSSAAPLIKMWSRAYFNASALSDQYYIRSVYIV